jgi:DNA-binding MarR family transcriptional regulator
MSVAPPHYDPASYTPDQSVSYLMKLATQTFLRNMDSEMQALDLTGMQWGPLMLIARGHCDTVAGCARASFSDCGAMTRMLDRLEHKGLLRRVRSTRDRRVIHLELTAPGDAVAQQIAPKLVAVLNQHLQGFSVKEVEQFKSLLRRYTVNGGTANDTAVDDDEAGSGGTI